MFKFKKKQEKNKDKEKQVQDDCPMCHVSEDVIKELKKPKKEHKNCCS